MQVQPRPLLIQANGSVVHNPTGAPKPTDRFQSQDALPSYQFITTTDSSSRGRHDEAARRLVRSHAMKALWREKKSSQAVVSPPLSSSEHIQLKGSIGRFRLSNKGGPKKAGQSATLTTAASSQEWKPSTRKLVAKELDAHTKEAATQNDSVFDVTKAIAKHRREIPVEVAPDLGSSRDKSDPYIRMNIPPTLFGVGRTDPFACAVLPLDNQMQSLVHHYVSDVPSSVHPVKFYKYHSQLCFLSMAIFDEGLLHSIIAYSLIHKFCFGTSPPPTLLEKVKFAKGDPGVLYHQTRAIQFVNKNLASGVVCDATVATVLTIFAQQAWVAGGDEIDVHFGGIERMVQCRGGLASLPSPFPWVIAFHDLKRSMLAGSKPRFPMRPHKTTISQIVVPVSRTDSIFCCDSSILTCPYDQGLYKILQDLHYFSAFIEYHKTAPGSFGDAESALFEEWNHSIEYRLNSYSVSNSEMNIYDSALLEAMRIAAILWLNTALWTYPPSSSIIASGLGSIVNLLKRSNLDSWRVSYPDVILWVLIISACCSAKDGQFLPFLLHQIKLVALRQGFSSYLDLDSSLRRFLYIEGMYGTRLHTLWEEIQGGTSEEFPLLGDLRGLAPKQAIIIEDIS